MSTLTKDRVMEAIELLAPQPTLGAVAVNRFDLATETLRSAAREWLEMREKLCPACGGNGFVDSGGMTPDGHGINVPCGCTREPELEYLRSQLAEARGQLAVERDQYEVLQLLLGDKIAEHKQQLLALEAEKEALVVMLNELYQVHIDCGRPSLTPVGRDRFDRARALLKSISAAKKENLI